MTFEFSNNISRKDAGVAITAVSGLPPAPALPAAAEGELRALLEARKNAPLSAAEEAVRAACRDILRNGGYKPTGRGKPASEYLLGAAKEGVFPRVNALVDINNLVSLKYLLPISLWDAGLCAASAFEFRLGRPEEGYVFNPSGQELDLEDLVCGCELPGGSLPIVTPIKDGMRTKVRPETGTAIGAIYYPAGAMTPAAIEAVNSEFLEKLLALAPGTRGGKLLLLPGEKKTLEI
jgi:DNA/RNA-binding domain of Phe-tRNA-synthetase-like protein